MQWNVKNLVVTPAILVALVVLIAYMGGFFATDRIAPDAVSAAPESGPAQESGPTPAVVAQAGIETVTEWYEAVGTVRPRTEATIEARVTGRVVNVYVRPGEQVAVNDKLVTLDNREYQARLEQARAGLASAHARRDRANQAVVSAQAVLGKADSTLRRLKALYQARALAPETLEQTETAQRQAVAAVEQAKEGLKEAEAGIRQAEQQVEEAEIALGYTELRATEPGEVVQRLVEPGDTAFPGKPLLLIQTSAALRLEAQVREGLIYTVRPGAKLRVVITAVNQTVEGTVEEVIPSADPITRSFLVKVAMPPVPGVYTGMFGRLLVPVGKRQAVVVPAAAIRRVGQLEMVTVAENGEWKARYVKTGERIGDKVEVLSGLEGNERVAVKDIGDARQ